MSDIETTGESIDADVAICGAGPVGMALAALLARRGVAGNRIVLIDGKSLGQAISDPRSIALAWGSRLLLEEVGAWPLPATAIHQIHVSRRGHLGRSLMDRDEHDLDALGYVARYGDVVDALARVCERAGVQVLRPLRVSGIDEHADGVQLRLDDGRTLQAKVAVQAEGGVFGEQTDKTTTRDYGQTAVIARVAADAPIAHRAFERFTDEGPLALLPQDGADGHQYALVWCVRPERAQHLLDLGESEFLRELGEAFGERLGRFTRTSARVAFPLGLNADPRATARTVAIGNAAQTLHPVAGQGLNLGLRDAAVLARLLAREMAPAALERFRSEREGDRGMVIRATDTMARAFAGKGPQQALFGLGLAALDTLKPARTLLAELMMFGRR
ncbi:2-octaprenyl-6-methoxyphenyl hydroxylase [Massilia sp. WF1]|uniref:UbiH/UbiF/VisC/COQ6 family ubiquinone biosynthesis hydroxylase n=1 Tax=unclassified Massilia TaxID=2609279 RepID=UPI000649C12D|nr:MULTISPECIES: UbiH/UbiF/VisC/COQ6 family ubiquinone biosynthesis hydroxylase [unclassified Massilia]ALK99127.1 2-octaprenyl-6-methoxyphenyl hydroxylase [Massilia sp. WG5]KLU35155.1 2-octaprenyl-6-methoxyphenyl hydroxylase [Massilia sp. WF1]